MARTLATNYTGTLQFPYATAGTDLFKKEDVQTLALAVDQHDHSSGKGLVIPAGSITMPFVDLQVTRNTWHGASTNNVIHPAPNQANNLNVEATQGMVGVSGRTNALISANAYYDGTNWFQYNTGAASMQLNMGASLNFYSSVAGSVTWVQQFAVSATGGGSFGSGITVNTNRSTNQGGIMMQAGSGSGSDVQIFSENGNMYVWLSSAGGNVAIQSPGGSAWRPLTCGAITAGGDVTANNLRLPSPGGVYFASAAAYTFNGTDSFIDTGASGGWYFRSMGGATRFWVSSNGAGTFYTSIALNSARGANAAAIIFQASVGGAANDYNIFSESGNLYIWGPNGIVNQGPGGSGWKPISASAFNVNSAASGKSGIAPIADPMVIVTNDTLHGVTYNDISGGHSVSAIGFVADAWLPIVPEVVALDQDGNVQGMDYAKVGAITFEALKNFAVATEARLAAIEARVEALPA